VTFASPYLLLALVAVPLVAAGYLRLDRRRRKRSASWTRAALLPNVVERPSRRVRYVPLALFLLGLTLLLVGFARPQRNIVAVQAEPPTVVLAFDVSGSMAARDVAPTRLAAARQVALQVLDDLPRRDRVAVLTFGNRVRVVVPPTLDRSTAGAHLPKAITPKAGTSLGDGISAGVAVVTEVGKGVSASGHQGLVLVLSDGAQTAGGATPEAAADIAFVERVPVDTVTVGTTKGVVTQPMSVDGFDTRVQIPVPTDPAQLRSVARHAEGTAYQVSSPAQAAPIGRDVARAEHGFTPSVSAERRVQQLGFAVGAAALAAILAALVVSGLWFGRIA
jgi:Ca-activated chloride channel family protein